MKHTTSPSTPKPSTPTPGLAAVAALAAHLPQLAALASPVAVDMSMADRQRLLKVRRIGDRVVDDMLHLVERHGVVLPGLTPDRTREHVALARALAPVVAQVGAVLHALENARMLARSSAYRDATAYYSALVGLGSRNPAVANELAPVRELFATRPRKGSGRQPASPTTPAETAHPTPQPAPALEG